MQHRGKPNGLTCQLCAQQMRSDARYVPRGEGQVDGSTDLVDASSELVIDWRAEWNTGQNDLLLRSRQACGHCRRRDEEQPGDLLG